jgi:hypothetical protein
MDSHKFHDRLKQNVQDVVALIVPGLADAQEGARLPSKLRQDSMKCFQVNTNSRPCSSLKRVNYHASAAEKVLSRSWAMRDL